MWEQAALAVAAAGGTAVVQAAGTDAWTALRNRVAALLGRDDPAAERAELERLDATAQALQETEEAGDTEDAQGASAGQRELVARYEQRLWAQHIMAVLAPLTEEQRDELIAALEELTLRFGPGDGTAVPGSGAVHGNTFHGPTAVQTGSGNRQRNDFGTRS